MSKVMLVEDDDSLREIYSIRLTAEGYAIVSAHDGEEALAVAVRERPDLIVSDVMMPKISGFDMLDILRSTPETKDIKVIMMTALSSEDQRTRGEALGADRYLVKSQVGIEDVVNAVHEVLGDRATNGVISTSAPQTQSNAPASSPAMFSIPAIEIPAEPPAPAVPAANQAVVQPAQATQPITDQAQAAVPPAVAQVQPTSQEAITQNVAQPAVQPVQTQSMASTAPQIQAPTTQTAQPAPQPSPEFDVTKFNIPPQSAPNPDSQTYMTTGQ